MSDTSKTVPFLMPTTDFADLSQVPVEVDFDSLLSDAHKLQLLYFLTNQYTRLFDSAKDHCLRLLDYSDVHYLLDFDVIRNYIEMRTLDKLDTFAVDFFFAHSKAKFSIPIGAFQELLDYLAHVQRTHRDWKSTPVPCSALEAKRFIATSLLVEDAGSLDSTSLDEAFEQSLDSTLVQLIRLLSLLNSERFQGVVTEYSHSHYGAWLSAISKLERPYRDSSTPRTEIDQRDAINLAIASASIPMSSKMPTCRLLITRTGTLLHATSQFDQSSWDELETALQIDRETLRYLFPAIHPRDSMLLELLGALNDPRAALTRAEGYEDTFRKLRNYLRAEVVSVRDPDDVRLKLGTFIVARRQRTRELLRQAAQGILAEQDELRKIEDARSQSVSVDLSKTRVQSIREDPREGQSLFFRRLLGQVARSLGVKSGIVYDLAVEDPTEHTPFRRFQVLESGDREPLITGEIYYDCAGNSESSYYAVRWPISCLEEQFIEALKTTWVINAASPLSDAEQGVRNVELDDNLWAEGVIISFPEHDVGIQLTVAYGAGDWKLLHIQELAKCVASHSQVRVTDSEMLNSEIQRIRINTLYGDLLYDVTVCPGYQRRHITILSHHNLALQIAGLYAHTGQSFCIPQKLVDVINNLLQQFPPIHSGRE